MAKQPDPTAARFPAAPVKAGCYESFYLKLCHPGRPLGAWIRLRLEVERAGAPPLAVELAGVAAYELGVRERDHGVAVQPYPDG